MTSDARAHGGTNWDGFEVEAIPLHTYLKRNLIHAELLGATLRRTRRAALEIGVGSGAQSAFLSHLVRRVVTIDNDARIMDSARQNLVRYGRNVEPILADAFALPFAGDVFDVALSQGLFEHFGDDDIARLLREQLRVSRSVVFSVPSDRYPRQDVGNERLMSPGQWGAIVRACVRDNVAVRTRYVSVDLESAKYSLLARRPLGAFAVLVTVDR